MGSSYEGSSRGGECLTYLPAREIDFRSLKLLLERSTGGSRFKKDHEIKRLTKAFKRGELVIPPNETEKQKWWRCEARFMLGDYSDWTGWEYRDDWAATLWHWRDTKPYPIDPWNGQRVKKLYVIGEQGIGDEVFFASCIPDALALAEEVVFECQPRLESIFQRAFALSTVPARIEGTKRYKRELPEGISAWVPLADLPRIFRKSLKDFPGTPYLTASPPQVERFAAYRGRVGVSWRGAQGTVPEIMEVAHSVSLQYDPAWTEDVESPDLDLRDDIEGVLGLLSNLEKVVTVSTSVAHFAAALGKETHVILADPTTGVRGNLFPFRWGCEATPGRTPWYSSARVYRNWREFESQHHRSWGQS